MNRRDFLLRAAVLVSGSVASLRGLALTEQQRQHMAAAPHYIATEAGYFDDAQRLTVAALAETIMPATDTPGAVDAGVPLFIELMVADWFNDRERERFDAGLKALMVSVLAEHGEPFASLAYETRQSILEDMEDAASDADWYSLGNLERDLAEAPFICQLKELTVWGFFTSEVGATQVLRHEMMPMRFDGDVPLEPGQGSWATPLV